MVLKEVALLTSCFCVLEGNLFPPRLTHGLERSLSASIFWLCHWLCWHYPFLWWLLCCLHWWSWKELTCVCLALCLPHVSLAGVLKGVLVHVHIAMVLKELDGWSWKDLDATLWFLSGVLPSIFKCNGLEKNLWSWCLSCFLWLKQAWKHFCIIHKWDLTSYLLGVHYDYLLCQLGLYNVEVMVLKWLIWGSAGVSVWYCHDLPASHHRNIQDLSWILSGIHLLGSLVQLVHEETWSWKDLRVKC